MEDLPLRYNIYFQQMQFIRDNDTLAFGNPSELKSVKIGDRNFIYSQFESEGTLDSSYFELLSDGYCRMLMRRKVEYHLVIDDKNCDQSQTYVKTFSYYLQRQGEPARQCIRNTKGMCTYFEDEEEQIRNFISVNDLNLKKCEDVKKVVEFYNVLKK
jgi:hypothetical protein